MNLKLICLLILILFAAPIFNIASAKTEVARVEWEFYELTLYNAEPTSTSGTAYMYLPLDSDSRTYQWKSKGRTYDILSDGKPQEIFYTLNNDASVTANFKNNILLGKWEQIDSSTKKFYFYVPIILFDDNTGYFYNPDSQNYNSEYGERWDMSWSKLTSNEYQITISSTNLPRPVDSKLTLYNNGDAVLSSGSDIIKGKWIGTLKTQSPASITPTAMQTPPYYPTPGEAAIIPGLPPIPGQPYGSVINDIVWILLILLLFGGIFYVVIQNLKSKKKSSTVESRPTILKVDKELEQLKSQKARLSEMLLKLDEKLISKEISEQNYKELKAKYETQLKDIEKQIVEIELHD